MSIRTDKRTLFVIVVVFISFLLFYLGLKNFKQMMAGTREVLAIGLLSYFVTYVLIGLPVFIGTYLISRDYCVFKSLGLHGNILQGILLALLFALPMFIGGFLFYRFEYPESIPNLIAATLFAGLFEELYYRGFLFGQLFKNTRLGFILSAITGALIFASQHLYQSEDLATLSGIFAVTFLGALFFGWLYVEWGYNLWVPIFLHAFMNLSWGMFDAGTNALGGVYSNIFRALTIALAITVTVVYKIRTGKGLAINRKTVWFIHRR